MEGPRTNQREICRLFDTGLARIDGENLQAAPTGAADGCVTEDMASATGIEEGRGARPRRGRMEMDQREG